MEQGGEIRGNMGSCAKMKRPFYSGIVPAEGAYTIVLFCAAIRELLEAETTRPRISRGKTTVVAGNK